MEHVQRRTKAFLLGCMLAGVVVVLLACCLTSLGLLTIVDALRGVAL